MTRVLNETHDAKAKSWITSANIDSTPFPIQNLPFDVYRIDNDHPRIGVAIGDCVLDLRRVVDAKLLESIPKVTQTACRSQYLNDLMSLTRVHWSELRRGFCTGPLLPCNRAP
jgi:fumarylacetoacetase